MISVCMATYNGEKYVEEQINSILSQLDTNDELIISDDGSTDNTISIIKEIKDRRINLYFNENNHGFSHNFENALKQAKGDYIFLADQDDIWCENKVKVMMQKLKKYNFVVSDCITVNQNLNPIRGSRFKEFNIKGGFFEHLVKSRYLGCCMAFDRKVLECVLPFPKNDFLLEHDIWIAAISMLYFKWYLIEEPLILYRRHGENVSSGGFSNSSSIFNMIIKRIYRIWNLIIRFPVVMNIRKGI